MDAREALEKRIDELCAEVERLRQENQSIGMAAYEVGYRNGSIHYELGHCPACKNIADLQEALAENAKLRGARDVWQENDAKLRELASGLWYCAHEAHGMCARVPVGGERPFTCCPLYDFDSKEYRCEKLMRELDIIIEEA